MSTPWPFSPDGKQLASASASASVDTTVLLSDDAGSAVYKFRISG